ncbi:twin-arginine translocase TatA/TatE family subunit [Agromyces sp. SYSU K20354]|uniref:twin-arginine translocase TatA/TatE family subunit n=1 Tax=Agromyces cavernae TaxID=2898659 RepID=UPI001E379729|nr:twin-arginine translocase TatA/TatE family subunit [Agromyces cavernae]MCD2440918.1 twin-arginine translocase TatA/TatE family subunit [Agromyces cavernae]
MFANLNGWHAVIVIAVILLLFGAPKIPQLARSLGQSMRILKTEIREEPGVAMPGATVSPVPDVAEPAAATYDGASTKAL